jgi:PAS domain S-box-containing protein
MVSWAAEDALKRFVAASPAVIFALNVDEAGELHHQWASPNLADLTGFVSDGTIDRGWWTSHLHPDDRSRVIAAHSAPYDVDHQVLEYRFQREDGSYVWLRDEKRLYRDAQGRPIEVVGSWSDITGRMALEQQFRQAQKMEAVGRLAGGVAHDFNNLLTVICGLSELMLQELPDDDVNRSLVVDIQRAGQRAVSLTRQLLAFSRKQVLNPKVIDLERIVGEVESMLRRLIGEDILLVIRTTGREQLARVDPGQLEQVMLNLAVNARDAMPKGGQLSIETGAVELTYEYCRQHPGSRPGRYVRLIVRDTGSGMPPDVVARLFEPFFTTKEAGKGTGLGLAMVFGIIKQSDGYIEVESEVGKGSAFIVYLPAVGGSQTDDEDAPSPSRVSSSGRETILLVEDEEDVRRLSKRALESFGYRVLEAASGEDALAIARANAATISLLITDVVMPGLSGPEVADRLTARHSSMRVLFVSGYIDDAVVRHGVVDGEHAFLQKPFMPAALAAKVREILDR